jgi:hypothetical protein
VGKGERVEKEVSEKERQRMLSNIRLEKDNGDK